MTVRSLVRRAIAVLVFALLPAAPAAAGLHYRAETVTTPENGKPQTTQVEAWVEGPRAKIVFTESDQPMLSQGSYLVTQDGGKTLYLVDPKEETYMEWDLQGMLSALGTMMDAMQGMMNLEFSDVAVEKLAQEPGGEILGYPVTHSRYRTTYTVEIKVLGMKRGSTTETVQDLWTTQAFGDPGLGVWLRAEPPATGMEDLDELIAAEMEKVEGFPLKTVALSTTTGQKGKRQTTVRSETAVELLEETSVPAETFEIPAGYARIEMTER